MRDFGEYQAQGARAYNEGYGRNACPYDDWRRDAWLDGWIEAWTHDED